MIAGILLTTLLYAAVGVVGGLVIIAVLVFAVTADLDELDEAGEG